MLTKNDMTAAQWEALTTLFMRQETHATLDAFVATARMDTLNDCCMVPCFGMWLGIEKDGYTHS